MSLGNNMMVKIPTFSRIITEYITFPITTGEKYTNLHMFTWNLHASFICQLMWFLLFSLNNMKNPFWKKLYLCTGNMNISLHSDFFINIVKPMWACHHPPKYMIHMTHHVLHSTFVCFYCCFWKVNLLLECFMFVH